MAMQHAVGVKLRELVLAELREHGVPAPSSDEQGQGGVIPDSELAALVQRKPAQAHFTVSLGAVERLASRALAAAGRPGARPSITAERAMQFVAPDGDLIQRVEPTAKADTLMVVPVARRLIPVLLEEAVLECRRGRELTSASADEGGGPAAEIWINLPPVDVGPLFAQSRSPSLVAPSQIDGAAPPNWNAMLEVAQQWAAECTRRLARLGIDLAIEAAYIDAARAQAARDLVMRLLDLAILDTKRNEDGSVGADLSKRGLGHALFAHSAAGELVPSSTAFEIADALSTAGSQTRELFWIYSEQRGHHYERIELVCNELTKACDAKFASNFMLPVGKTTPEVSLEASD
nr:hypothetical protein HK105_002810 [Polyrhizophydium stewartii]